MLLEINYSKGLQHYETLREMDSADGSLAKLREIRTPGFFEESDPLVLFIPDAEATCLAELGRTLIFAVEVLAVLPAPFSGYCE